MSDFSRRRFIQLAAGGLGGALGVIASGCTAQAPATIQRELPPCIDDGLGWPVLRGPYLQRQAQIAAFLLQADTGALKKMCDRYLNLAASAPFDYAPLAPYVLLLLADMEIVSLDARDSALGWTHETELSFWVPTVARIRRGGLLAPDHIAWFLPWLFADNPYAIATGREVFGFAKTLGQFQRPSDMRQPEFALEVWGAQQTGPTAEYRPLQLLEARQANQSAAGNITHWASWQEAQAELVRMMLGNNNSSQEALFDPNTLEMPMVFLKQFPAASDTRRAAYQAIVEAPARVQQFYAGQSLAGAYQLIFSNLASHPLHQLLGLSASQDSAGKQTALALAAAWLRLDFTLEHGVEVWRA